MGGKGGQGKSGGKDKDRGKEKGPAYISYFDGTWVKPGVGGVTYDIEGAKNIVIFDDNSKNTEYRFEAISWEECQMKIGEKVHTGKMNEDGSISWSNGSSWVKPSFDGTWVKEDSGATFDVQPGRNIVQFDDGMEFEFDVRDATTCVMIIKGKEHTGTLSNPNTLTWSTGSTWVKPNFGGRWQKEGARATFFVNPAADTVTFDDGATFLFEVKSINSCMMVINGKVHTGELTGHTIKWLNGSVWTRIGHGGGEETYQDPGGGLQQLNVGFTPINFSPQQLRDLGNMKPGSGRFYRDLVGLRADAEPASFSSRYDSQGPMPGGYGAAAMMPAGASASGAQQQQQRSVFGCPCCGRLFHVYVEGGQYHAVVAKGLEGVRVQLKNGSPMR